MYSTLNFISEPKELCPCSPVLDRGSPGHISIILSYLNDDTRASLGMDEQVKELGTQLDHPRLIHRTHLGRKDHGTHSRWLGLFL